MKNFGRIKNIFNGLFVESLIKKDAAARELFKKYVKTIKENEILKTEFLVYNNIESKVEPDTLTANFYVFENIKLLDSFSKEDILSANNKLVALLGAYASKLNEDYELSELHESLSDLIFTKKTAYNVDRITEGMKKVTSYISTNKHKEVNESFDLPNSVVSKLMVEKFNEKYSSMDEADRKVIKAIIDNDTAQQKEIYNNTVTECVTIIDNLLKNITEGDAETTEKLQKVKNKLLSEGYDGEMFLDKFSKLLTLKNGLR